MADSTITSAVAAVEAKVIAPVVATESAVLTFIKAHYTKVVFGVLGAAIVYVWKVLL
jgi:hypothetical protein